MNSPPDNVIWHTLSGPHRRFSVGTDRARRYAPGFSPILGFAAAEAPDFADLFPFCAADEHFYCGGWSGPVQAGWTIEAESTMYQMVWTGSHPDRDHAPDATQLGAEHAAQAVDLATLTRPGPFGLRTLELGDYFGYFDGMRLVAMAGERMCVDGFREISGVCTHPEHQGRGYARRLMGKLICRAMHRGETPFLHVMCDNTSAWQFYERLGFRRRQESVVRVVAPR
jgi:ribosomal protein S18 acetylase RimI-like enzyme